MPKPFLRLSALLAFFCLSLLILLSCSPQIAATPETTTAFAEPTASRTQEIITTLPRNTEEVVLFSYEEDGDAHLFAYSPDDMPLMRLTAGEWDDISPAPSPDGEKIAFASNRSGFWDLYLLELASGDVTQLTDTPEYEGAPSWSPDGSFLAFEAYEDDNLNIIVGPADDPLRDFIRLTAAPSSDHSPAWAPGGRQIAFISDGEVILANLDESDDSRFQNLSNTALASESHPVWSPDGSRLAWASSSLSVGRSGIYVWEPSKNVPASWIGDGNWPAWNAAGDQLLATLAAPNSTYLTAYSMDGRLLQPLTPFPAPAMRGLSWASLVMPGEFPDSFRQAAELTPAPLWAANAQPAPEGPSDRWSVVDLEGVQAPYPKLHDLADEAFAALRERVQGEVGWDALAALENAFVPITMTLDPGFGEDWLYTGRAFAINSLMTNAGWMVAVREDFGAQTYWRLYLRAQLQDGSLGEPLRDTPWDLSARYNLDPRIYEQGGTYSEVPEGYWVDVTSLALQYDWERVPALPNWRTFYRGARFSEFALTGGMDWYSAMLQLYPPDVLVTPTRVLPPTITPTRTPLPTWPPLPPRTPRPTVTASPTRSPTITRTPTGTLQPSPTPPTIVP
jgi:TolB protein